MNKLDTNPKLMDNNEINQKLRVGDYAFIAEVTGYARSYVKMVLNGTRKNPLIKQVAEDYLLIRENMKIRCKSGLYENVNKNKKHIAMYMTEKHQLSKQQQKLERLVKQDASIDRAFRAIEHEMNQSFRHISYENLRKHIFAHDTIQSISPAGSGSKQKDDELYLKLAHDFKDYLNSFKALIDIIKSDGMSPEEIHEAADSLENKYKQLYFFINNLLYEYRHQESITDIDFEKIIRQQFEEVAYLYNKHIKKEYEIMHKEKPFFQYEGQVYFLLRNVIANAIKYQRFHDEQGYIRILVSKYDKRADVTVSDNGKGMNHAFREKLFEKHSHNDKITAGAGLGMHFFKQTIEQLSGTVTIDSQPGAGTTISFSLPTLK